LSSNGTRSFRWKFSTGNFRNFFVNGKRPWFPTVTEEEILAVYTAAVLSNTKKTSKFGLAVFTSTVLLFLAVKLSLKTNPKRFVLIHI